MTLDEITKSVAIFTDEDFGNDDLLVIANKGISRINTNCKTKFPHFESNTEQYTAIPKHWLLDLISAWTCYGIKMNDSAMQEASEYLDEFYKILNDFNEDLGTMVENYEMGDTENGISSDYIDEIGFGGVYGIDTSNAVNVGYFGNQGNGGCY